MLKSTLNELHDAGSGGLDHKDKFIVSWQLNAIGKVQLVQQNFGGIMQWITAQQSVQFTPVFYNWGSMEPKGSANGIEGFHQIKSRNGN